MANSVDPDQTAPVLGPHCLLLYLIPYITSIRELSGNERIAPYIIYDLLIAFSSIFMAAT